MAIFHYFLLLCAICDCHLVSGPLKGSSIASDILSLAAHRNHNFHLYEFLMRKTRTRTGGRSSSSSSASRLACHLQFELNFLCGSTLSWVLDGIVGRRRRRLREKMLYLVRQIFIWLVSGFAFGYLKCERREQPNKLCAKIKRKIK